jgi:hypothetical protein
MLLNRAGSASFQSRGGNVRRTGSGTADRAQDPGEGDPVRIQIGGFGGFGDEGGDGVVDDQPGPDLLVDQIRQA